MSQPCPHLGLIISVTRHASPDQRDADALKADLLAVLEANDLVAAIRGAREYRVSREGGQVTDLDRQLLLEWAARWAPLATIGVSAVTDLDDGD
jgi:hypothetical protein